MISRGRIMPVHRSFAQQRNLLFVLKLFCTV